MSSVAKKSGGSKTASRGRRIRAKTPTRRGPKKAVSEGIEQAPEKAAIAATADELAALRELADCAESLFEGEGLSIGKTGAEILSEALICARADLDLLQDGAGSGIGIDSMMFVRTKHRIDLALKLASYRDRFGPTAGGAS